MANIEKMEFDFDGNIDHLVEKVFESKAALIVVNNFYGAQKTEKVEPKSTPKAEKKSQPKKKLGGKRK